MLASALEDVTYEDDNQYADLLAWDGLEPKPADKRKLAVSDGEAVERRPKSKRPTMKKLSLFTEGSEDGVVSRECRSGLRRDVEVEVNVVTVEGTDDDYVEGWYAEKRKREKCAEKRKEKDAEKKKEKDGEKKKEKDAEKRKEKKTEKKKVQEAENECRRAVEIGQIRAEDGRRDEGEHRRAVETGHQRQAENEHRSAAENRRQLSAVETGNLRAANRHLRFATEDGKRRADENGHLRHDIEIGQIRADDGRQATEDGQRRADENGHLGRAANRHLRSDAENGYRRAAEDSRSSAEDGYHRSAVETGLLQDTNGHLRVADGDVGIQGEVPEEDSGTDLVNELIDCYWSMLETGERDSVREEWESWCRWMQWETAARYRRGRMERPILSDPWVEW